MKKLAALLNTPARAVIAVGLLILVIELLIMLSGGMLSHILEVKHELWDIIDPILLVLIISPLLYTLIFRPMRYQQAEIERQMDELRRFQRLSIGRELRMKELVEGNATLHHPLSAKPAGDFPVTSGSVEAPRHAVAQHVTTQLLEESQCSALLFMLEDLENARKKIEQAHQEWMAALDVVNAPIFLHDEQFRILRCNKAYQQRTGMPFKHIIGKLYYEVFPKNHAPMQCCLRAMEQAAAAEEEEEEEEEEVAVGDAIYRSCAFSVKDEQGTYLYSVHTLEDITESKQAEEALRNSETKYRLLIESLQEGIWMIDKDANTSFVNLHMAQMLGYSVDEMQGRHLFSFMDERGKEIATQNLERRKQGIREQHDFELLRKGGNRIYTSMATSPILDKAGNYAGALAGVTDITERKLAENALREAKHELQEFFDLVPDMVCIASVSGGCFQQVNKIWETALGFTTDELIGKPFIDFIHPDDVASTLAEVERQLAGQQTVNFINRYRCKDGSYKWLEWVAKPARKGKLLYAAARDITERKQAEEELRLRAQLLDSASDTIFMVDFDGNFVYLNEAAWKTRGYTRDEMMGINLHVLDTPKYEKLIESRMRDLMKNGQCIFESEHRRKDGSTMPIEISARIIESDGRKLVLSMIRDITERKQAEEALKESEEKYRSIYENTQVGLYRTRVIDGKLMMANDAMAKMFGFDSFEEATAKYITSEHYVDPGTRERLLGAIQKYGRFDNFEACLTRNDGIARWFQYSGRLVQNKGYIEGVATDITERKQAEQRLKDLSDRLQHILASTPAVHYACQFDGEHFVPTFASTNLKAIWGYDPAEYLDNAEWWWSGIHPEERGSVVEAIRAAVMAADRRHYAHEYRFRRKDGAYRWIHDELQIIRDHAGQPLEIVGSWLDITERKQAEAAAQHANRALATLGAVNRTLVHATDESELLQTVCNAIVEQKGYRLAWVGYKQVDEHKSIKIMARAGHDEGYLDTMQLTWAETERGMGPSGRAICSGKTQVCQDIASDPLYRPWRDEALKRGFAASIALPLTDENVNKVFGILNVYAGEANAFTPAEIDLLEEMAGDLAFGVRSLHIRHERDLALVKNQHHLVQLQDSLEDTVRAMASLVEMRDPYTAGHQARVADLAVAIARQMGLPEEQTHAIHLAGTLHDLGKIKIPAEILSKPGRITDIEFSLIKIHSQAGHDILKGISFPWPIAQMVLQHHERLDGSGYPQGLKGDQIILEARILSVADVVEAISAHRPYRPGLGIEAALAEISKQRDIHFDPAVVDACLALFREQHYSFK